MRSRAKAALDRVQQRHRAAAFPLAVLRKAGDDRATTLSALIAYYAFFAIFPLLLVLVTVLGIVLRHDPGFKQRLIDSALGQFPVIGTQLVTDGQVLHGSGVALAIGIVGTFLGGRGMASAFRNASDVIWAVPRRVRTKGVLAFVENLCLLLAVGIGLVGTSVASGYAVGTLDLGAWGRVFGLLLSGVLNAGVFALALRLATSRTVPTRSLLPGAVLAAVAWTALQVVGGLLVTRQIARASDVYGTFAIVIGLLTWLYISAYATILAIEVDVVRVRHLWPRSFFDRDHLTHADREAYTAYAQSEARSDDQRIRVTYDE